MTFVALSSGSRSLVQRFKFLMPGQRTC
jgi:hypothetical protein